MDANQSLFSYLSGSCQNIVVSNNVMQTIRYVARTFRGRLNETSILWQTVKLASLSATFHCSLDDVIIYKILNNNISCLAA